MVVGGKTQLHRVRLNSNQNFLVKAAYSSQPFVHVLTKRHVLLRSGKRQVQVAP